MIYDVMVLRNVEEVESFWQLEVQLDSGALMWPFEGIRYYYINLWRGEEEEMCKEKI